MKRFGRVAIVALVVVMMTSSLCFAGTLELVENYPENGSKNAAIDNFGVKLYFNEDVYGDDALAEANEDCFVIVDEDGKTVPTMVVYSPKEKNLVLVLAKQNVKDDDGESAEIKQDTEYTLTISDELQAANGDVMAKAEKISFRTLNQTKSTVINMVLMGVMFAAIFVMSTRSAKKELKKKVQEEKVNPYKVAKETGKSVEEVVAADQKAKKKKAERAAWKAMMDGDDEEEEEVNDNKRVKGPRPISAGGSTYITGRKALAEKKAAEARAKGTTRPKNKKGGKKKKK